VPDIENAIWTIVLLFIWLVLDLEVVDPTFESLMTQYPSNTMIPLLWVIFGLGEVASMFAVATGGFGKGSR
jgi:hypothetical protein